MLVVVVVERGEGRGDDGSEIVVVGLSQALVYKLCDRPSKDISKNRDQ